MEAAAVAPLLDGGQIKKATRALLAYHANKEGSGEKVLLDVDETVFLMVTVWKIPPQEQTVKIILPHSVLPATSEVCLFTKDEPGLSAEQTENLYKKLLAQHGITCITEVWLNAPRPGIAFLNCGHVTMCGLQLPEFLSQHEELWELKSTHRNMATVISYKTFKTEYKPYEAKRRLLSRFTLFLSDDRIRRFLPSHMGRHFYLHKKAPLCVNLKAKDLAKEFNKRICGTILPVTNKGSCYVVRVGNTSMEASEIAENVMAAARVIAVKAPKIWKSVKLLHLKTNTSLALPVFNSAPPSDAAGQRKAGAEVKQAVQGKKKRRRTKQKSTDQINAEVGATGAPKVDQPKADGVEPAALKSKEEEEEEETPHLVPIETSPAVRKIETSPAVKKEQVARPSLQARNKLDSSSPNLRSRRKASLSAKTPVAQPETPREAAPLEESRQLGPGRKSKIPKQTFLEKMQAEDARPPLAKPVVMLKRLKLPKSDKKFPKTPKCELRKMKVPL